MTHPSLIHPSQHRTWVEINCDAVAHNVAALREKVGPDVLIMPSVKANAYGHGATIVASAALEAGAHRLGVATVAEGEALRYAGITCPVQILGACLPEEIDSAVEHQLIISLHEPYIAHLVALAASNQERTATVHMKIDTGMGRLGILPEEVSQTIQMIQDLPNVYLEGVYMHFAEATDEIYTQQQIARFNAVCEQLARSGMGDLVRHAASTVPAVLYPKTHYDAIRPGIGFYGICTPSWLRGHIDLRPVLSWRSSIIQTKDYPQGSNLGYNRTYTTRRPTRVAILPVGYADGYMRQWSNCADILIRGRRCPVIGMVSMDYTMVDVTDVPDVGVGTQATLIGYDGDEHISVEELASLIPGQIPYEIPVRISARVPRIPVEDDSAS